MKKKEELNIKKHAKDTFDPQIINSTKNLKKEISEFSKISKPIPIKMEKKQPKKKKREGNSYKNKTEENSIFNEKNQKTISEIHNNLQKGINTQTTETKSTNYDKNLKSYDKSLMSFDKKAINKDKTEEKYSFALENSEKTNEKSTRVIDYKKKSSFKVSDQPLFRQSGKNEEIVEKEKEIKRESSFDFFELVKRIKNKAINVIPIEKIEYNHEKVLGEGGFGTVILGRYYSNDVAVKEMFLNYEEFKVLEDELTFLSTFRHPKIVSLFGISLEEKSISRVNCSLVMELMDFDLEDIVFGKKKENLSYLQKINILSDVIQGLVFLHDNHVVHRDIKPKNILLNKSFDAKITDLGIAKVLENKEKTSNITLAFTARYASKEVVIEGQTSFKSDLWSFGLLAYELMTGVRSWNELNPAKIIIMLSKEESPFGNKWKENSYLNNEIIEIIENCVEYNVEKRKSAKEIYNQIDKIKNELEKNKKKKK